MSYGSFSRTSGAIALLLALSAAPAFTVEYRDPKGVFALIFDDNTWSVDKDASDFGLECREEACKGAIAGCIVTKQWFPLLSAKTVLTNLGTGDFAQGQIEGLAEEKKVQEKSLAGRMSWDDRFDVPAQLVERPAQRQIAGLSVVQAEFRMSLVGKVNRYVSFATAGASHAITLICHASEEAIGEWRPRFEALIASLRVPAPKSR